MDGACFVLDNKVGEPCSIRYDSEGVLTEIRLSSVTNHTQLYIQGSNLYSTFFAPDCVFPTPKTGAVMPKASLPLSRFMGGYNEVDITFAASVDQTNFLIKLFEGPSLRCLFENSLTSEKDPQFCQLTFRNEKKEVWFTGKFNKSEYGWETYEWHLGRSIVSVFVNWTQTGNSPEDGVCSHPVIPNCAKELPVFYGEPSVKWGSSVVTETSGPSPILRYITEFEPSVYLDNEELSITNGACFVLGDKVGEPCSFTNDPEGVLTEIMLSSVTNHTQLSIKGSKYYGTFFAPDCVFPKPKTGTVMPEASLPLSRYMGGHQVVSITFAAFVGQTDFSTSSTFCVYSNIELYEGEEILCHFSNSQRAEGDPQFCQLTFRNEKKEVWFTGKFNKSEYGWQTYEWHLGRSIVSVFVNWTQTGNSPEDGVCSHLVIPNRDGEPSVKWGSSVVTETSGPSPILRYITDGQPLIALDNKPLDIINGSCFVLNDKVGEPCSFTNVSGEVLTEIRLSSVASHRRLMVGRGRDYYTHFAPDCVFPTPMTGAVIPEASLPLSRFMGGHKKVSITFAAFVGQTDFSVGFREGEKTICYFQNSLTDKKDPQFCQLSFRNENKEVWFSGIFKKGKRDWQIYEWFSGLDAVSVFVNWTATGNSPEDAVCSHLIIPNCAKEMTVFSGLMLFLVINLLG
ncbi:hypothetical protein AAHC03_010326 [Spirometra sp. Aus1]